MYVNIDDKKVISERFSAYYIHPKYFRKMVDI